ncbi:hypothetical protein PAMP_014557 [Pampus punctatissimus]
MSVTEKGVECFGLKDMVRPPPPCPPVRCCFWLDAVGSVRRPPPSLRLLAASFSLGRSPADRLQEETSCPYPAGFRHQHMEGRSDRSSAANSSSCTTVHLYAHVQVEFSPRGARAANHLLTCCITITSLRFVVPRRRIKNEPPVSRSAAGPETPESRRTRRDRRHRRETLQIDYSDSLPASLSVSPPFNPLLSGGTLGQAAGPPECLLKRQPTSTRRLGAVWRPDHLAPET